MTDLSAERLAELELWRERTFATLAVLGRAFDGDVEPLARWIEDGHPLDEPTRKWLAAHLRGQGNSKPGLKRTVAQQVREAKVIAAFEVLRDVEERVRGLRGSKARAMRALIDIDPSISERMLKRYLTNHRGTSPDIGSANEHNSGT